MKKVKLLTIDKCYKPKELYRYNIKFENSLLIASVGSCFCYDSFEEAYEACEKALIIELSNNKKIKVKICDPNCEWLDPKEHNQSKRKEGHLCTRFNKVLKHGKYHPELIACSECVFDSYAI